MSSETPILIPVAEPIVIVPYNPAWLARFTLIRQRLNETLDGLSLDIIHIGSTSVFGLAAKPIIDLDVIIDSEEFLSAVSKRLAELGYIYEGDLGISGRHAFRSPADLPNHHLYVCAKDNQELLRHIGFRDFLRKNPAEATAYAALKFELASTHGRDRDSYSRAKTEFVVRILRQVAIDC